MLFEVTTRYLQNPLQAKDFRRCPGPACLLSISDTMPEVVATQFLAAGPSAQKVTVALLPPLTFSHQGAFRHQEQPSTPVCTNTGTAVVSVYSG